MNDQRQATIALLNVFCLPEDVREMSRDLSDQELLNALNSILNDRQKRLKHSSEAAPKLSDLEKYEYAVNICLLSNCILILVLLYVLFHQPGLLK